MNTIISGMDCLRAWAEDFCWRRGHTLAGVLSAKYTRPPYDSPLWPIKRELAAALCQGGYLYRDIGLLMGCSSDAARYLVKKGGREHGT